MPHLSSDPPPAQSTRDEPTYTVSNVNTVSALLNSSRTFTQEFQPVEISAASRAVLRHQSFRDEEHFLVGQGGLHPSYIVTKSTMDLAQVGAVTLLDASFKDVLDAVRFLG